MRLSTQLSHARLRLKHKLLRLRLQQPLYYKTLSVLVLAFAAGGIVAAYFLFVKQQEPISYADQFDLVINSYSLNGKITEVGNNSFTLQTSIVENQNGVNTVKSVTKTVNYTVQTAVYVTTINGTQVTSKTGDISKIEPGKNITVYVTENPAQSHLLNATKLEILE